MPRAGLCGSDRQRPGAQCCLVPVFQRCGLRPVYFQPVQSIAGDDIAWGLGVGLIRKESSVRWHWGDNDGFKSLALWDQQTGDGLVVTTNSDNGLSLCYDLASELTDADFLAAMAAFIETAE